jgi:cytochrome c553
MKRLTNIFLFTLFAGLVSGAHAAGDAAAGQALSSERCQACHGADGNSADPQYPRLAGQHADYLVRALTDYKSGARNNAIMSGFAAGLSEQDMDNLAAWFASQSGVVTPTGTQSAAK